MFKNSRKADINDVYDIQSGELGRFVRIRRGLVGFLRFSVYVYDLSIAFTSSPLLA